METDLQIWLDQAIQGNDEAFCQLAEHYQQGVHNLCYRMLGNRQEAEDASQEVFWRAYKALHRYDQERSFQTWLLSIASQLLYQKSIECKKERLSSIMNVPVKRLDPGPGLMRTREHWH